MSRNDPTSRTGSHDSVKANSDPRESICTDSDGSDETTKSSDTDDSISTSASTSSSNTQSESSHDEVGPQQQPALPILHSLGVLQPLFDMVQTNWSDEEFAQQQQFDDFHMEFVSDDTHFQPDLSNVVEYMPTTSECGEEENAEVKVIARPSFLLPHWDTTTTKTESDAYPRKSDRKVTQIFEKSRERDEQGELGPSRLDQSVTNVTPFLRCNTGGETDTASDFKKLDKPIISTRKEETITLPDWINPLPNLRSIDSCKKPPRHEEQLRSAVRREYEIIQQSKPDLWERTLESVGDQDFRKIFMYISSKVDLVDTEILSLKYSNVNDTLALGSVNGILKLVQFDSTSTDITATVVRNESLIGHTEDVTRLAWTMPPNSRASQLMSTDAHGVIIGWLISNTSGNQQVHFLQDESSSVILDFAWSPDSTRVAIIYSDLDQEFGSLLYGLVVGSWEGNREWGKSLRSAPSPPQAVAWLDETRFLVVQDNSICANSYSGEQLQARYFTDDELGGRLGKLVSLLVKPINTTWKNTGSFTIGLIWENKICLLRTVNDLQGLIFDPQLTISCSDWSPNGVFIAVGGTKRNLQEVSGAQVNIFNFSGKLLTTLKIGSPSISTISWDWNSIHLAMGSETVLYVGTVKPVYKFASNGHIHAYAFSEDDDNFVAFWDRTNMNVQKVEGKVVDLQNHGDRFVLLSINSEGIYAVAVITKAGFCVDALIMLEVQPFAVRLTDVCVVCLGPKSILLWRYISSLSHVDVGDNDEKEATGEEGEQRKKANSVKQIHIDDRPSASCSTMGIELTKEDFSQGTLNPAVCMDAQFDRLFVARFSGKLQIYSLPQGGLLQVISTGTHPFQILLNPTGIKIVLLDVVGCLRFGYSQQNRTRMKVDAAIISSGILSMLWSKDMPDFLCVMKRTEMCIIRHGVFETFPKFDVLSGCLAGFNNLAITFVKLDEILHQPKRPNSSHIFKVDMQILDAIRQSFSSGDEMQITAYKENVKHLDHPRMWNVLGEEELKRGNFDDAEFAFVHSANYSALQFLNKQLKFIPPQLQEAEILAYLGDYINASKCYVTAKRLDLALEMWQQLDDPRQRCRILAEVDGSGDASHDINANNYSVEKAEKHFSEGEIPTALEMFRKLKEYDRIFECHMVTENFLELKELTKRASHGDPVIGKIAEKYRFLGMTREAVDLYLKCGDPKSAVNVAMTNLEWSLALEIATEHGIPMVTESILELTKQLLSSGNIMQAVQFLKKCGKNFAAGKLLSTTALRALEDTNSSQSLMNIKKLFVMGAILLREDGITRQNPFARSRTKPRTKLTFTSSSVDEEDEIDFKFNEFIPLEYQARSAEEFRWMYKSPWRGAMATHYFILVLKAIHTNHFERAASLVTYLRNYTDILGVERVNCIIAWTSIKVNNAIDYFAALSQLENIDASYGDIATEVLTVRQERSDDDNDEHLSPTMTRRGSEASVMRGDSSDNNLLSSEGSFYTMPRCTISGKMLKSGSLFFECPNCGGPAMLKKAQRYKHCPLCHARTFNN